MIAIDESIPPLPVSTPTIYAFASTHPIHAGLPKVGYTERVAADRLIGEQRYLNAWKTGMSRE